MLSKWKDTGPESPSETESYATPDWSSGKNGIAARHANQNTRHPKSGKTGQMESVSADHANSAAKSLTSEKVTAKPAKVHNACKPPKTSARQKKKVSSYPPYAQDVASIINTIFHPADGSATASRASGANDIHIAHTAQEISETDFTSQPFLSLTTGQYHYDKQTRHRHLQIMPQTPNSRLRLPVRGLP